MTPVILSPVIENGFRRTMVMSDGSMTIFFERPGTIIMMVIIAVIAGAMAYMSHRRKKSVITEATKEPSEVR